MAAAKFNGVFKFESQEKFEDYLKAIGVGMAQRKVGGMQKPTLTLKIEGDEFYFKSESSIKTTESKVAIGTQFDETTVDGRKCKSTVKWEGDTLIHEQTWGDGNTSSIARHIDDQGRLVVVCKYKKAVSTRIFKPSS